MKEQERDKKLSLEELISTLNNFEESGDFDSCEIFLSESAENGNPDALALIGSMYLHQDIYDIEKAKSWTLQAAQSGSTLGMYNYGILLREEDESNPHALIWLEKAAQSGDVNAYMDLAEIYERSNTQKSIDYYKFALSLDKPFISFKIGSLYRKLGEDIQSQVWLKKAGDLGSPDAIIILARDCELSEDLTGARFWHEKLLELEFEASKNSNPHLSDNHTKKPALRLIRTPREAEEVAAEWLRYLGFLDASVTPVGPDQGIDVNSSEAVAQVKMEGVSTSRPTVQGLAGVAALENKKAFFFSLGGFTSEAIAWSEKANVFLFQFDLQGEPRAINTHARKIIQETND
jgi:TPR repeat protein